MRPLSIAPLALLLCTVSLFGCADNEKRPPVDPHEMSAASHETTAAVEERAAVEHEAQYDPSARQRRENCRYGRAAAEQGDPCWTSVTNPTSVQLRLAEEHRTHAAQHRAASQTLRDAEARACAGVPASDRDESPFEHTDDISSIEDLYSSAGRLEGAVVVFRPVRGMTASWLQRVVDCHLARNVALGNDVPEMASCPLVPKSVRAAVVARGDRLAVEIRSNDEVSAQEVAKRAHSIVSAR